jgi:hypothetical protein
MNWFRTAKTTKKRARVAAAFFGTDHGRGMIEITKQKLSTVGEFTELITVISTHVDDELLNKILSLQGSSDDFTRIALNIKMDDALKLRVLEHALKILQQDLQNKVPKIL